MSEKIQAIVAELRRRLEVLYGPRLVRLVLYGSQARGEAETGSDVQSMANNFDSARTIRRILFNDGNGQ